MPSLHTYIAGVKFREGGLAHLAKLSPEATFTLVLDPENTYDANAVKVMSGEFHLGYVPQVVSRNVAKIVREGRVISCVRYDAKAGIEISFRESEEAAGGGGTPLSSGGGSK